MPPCPTLTDAQKAKAMPLVIATYISWIVCLISYTGVGLYVLLSYTLLSSHPSVWVMLIWMLGTRSIRLISSEICIRRLKRICKEDASTKLGFWFDIIGMPAILLGLFYFIYPG